MNMIYFGAALVFILAGHSLRCSRWKNMLLVYEEVPPSRLLSSMSLGYFTDMLLPFHAGDLVRAVVCGKKLKNKTSFALATIIIDRLLDVHIVTLIYLIFYLTGHGFLMPSAIIYIILTVVLTLLIFWSVTFNRPLKKSVLACSSVFNKDIQLWIMSFFWAFRCTVKGIINKENKLKLMFKTLAMWLCYLSSYFFLAKVLRDDTLAHCFDRFFSLKRSNSILFLLPNMKLSDKTDLLYIAFNLVTAFFLVGLSFSLSKLHKRNEDRLKAELIVPYSSDNNRLDFLTIYFSDIRERENIRLFLNLNRGVNIIRNCSAGSNATTLLCIKDGRMIFRKYALGKDATKLNEQVKWLKDNSYRISVTDILGMEYDEKICCYDMPYLNDSVSFFDYIHSSTSEASWEILKKVLDDLECMYSSSSAGKADPALIKEYVSVKVLGNLRKITEAGKLKSILSYDEIIINGKKYKNLNCFTDMLMSEKFWTDAFRNDYYSTIHGDLTIENIICNRNYPKGYYLIDPNDGNIHNSPNLDYAKLLQSLHGGYEFLMKTHNINVSGNELSFNMIRSSSYDKLYKYMREYMISSFPPERVRSIFLHEIIHWFRLMPYKINNDSERVLLFYAGMIVVINDILNEDQK